ncbi:hypothetical protein FACS1894166_09760 [Bacilli bacterium]|nr:hypothetical protein FACS1894166_09760 [Bacilli bacterium]
MNFKKYAEFFGYNNSKFGVSTMEVLFHNRQHPTSAMNKIIFENCENIIIPV